MAAIALLPTASLARRSAALSVLPRRIYVRGRVTVGFSSGEGGYVSSSAIVYKAL